MCCSTLSWKKRRSWGDELSPHPLPLPIKGRGIALGFARASCRFPPPCGEGLRVGGASAIQRARGLRQSMTGGEKRLWSSLRTLRNSHGLHVRRQVPIGPYIADFAIHSIKLIIEVDGEHHQIEPRQSLNAQRDGWFAAQGYRTLRFSTGDVIKNKEGCVLAVLDAATPPLLTPLHQGEGNCSEITPPSGDQT